ncbi:MAG TPA: DUF1289 domain-containing protein [Gammaproteobacteria bacterium]|nr:DUF1289 domain-containing protein [Gammaproteobacteria bacterium]
MSEVPEPCSPCCQVCRLDGQGICIGCGRSAEEIRCWLSLDREGRWAILRTAAERRRKLNNRGPDE